MKMNFKYVSMMACAALMAGFTGCSNDSESGDIDKTPVEGTHEATIRVVVEGGKTRADQGSAVGITPETNDFTFYFVEKGGNVEKIVDFSVAADIADLTSAAGKTIEDIPNNANAVYVVGNKAAYAVELSGNIITEGLTAESTLINSLYVLDNQGGTGAEHAKVNISGYTTYTPIVGGTPVVLNMTVTPSVSRYEIKEVAAFVGEDSNNDAITAFDLEGMYINNNSKKIGFDYTYYPVGQEIACNNIDPVWYAAIPTSYEPKFCDETFAAATGVTSVTAVNSWGYYVAPAAKMLGSNYIGNVIPTMSYNPDGTQAGLVNSTYTAMPIVVLRLNNVLVSNSGAPAAAVVNGSLETGFSGTNLQYITVTKYRDQFGALITHTEPGKVYQIDQIEFKAENLTDQPVSETDHDVTAIVTVKKWEGVPTTPEL